MPVGKVIIVEIEPGMAAVSIGELLAKKQVVDSAKRFAAQARSQNYENSLQAGEYEFVSGEPYKDILEKISKGETRKIKIVVPEGYNIKQIANLLEENSLVKKDDFLAQAKNFTPYAYMKTDDSLVEYKTEGFLFPATYYFSPKATPQDVLIEMTRAFDDNLSKQMQEQIKKQDMTIREFVTLASLVEKEAAVAKDRPIIAKVFLKRIDYAMPLQSCATIQYILGSPKPELTVADTKLPSAYNTYLHYGLPPGPIASPGLASMQAVLQPSGENYLYFVAKKDGSHIFSNSYEEHLAAIEQASK